jgi:hypothetical protein
VEKPTLKTENKKGRLKITFETASVSEKEEGALQEKSVSAA